MKKMSRFQWIASYLADLRVDDSLEAEVGACLDGAQVVIVDHATGVAYTGEKDGGRGRLQLDVAAHLGTTEYGGTVDVPNGERR